MRRTKSREIDKSGKFYFAQNLKIHEPCPCTLAYDNLPQQSNQFAKRLEPSVYSFNAAKLESGLGVPTENVIALTLSYDDDQL